MLTVFIQAVSAFADPALGAFRTKSDQILFGLSPTQPLSMDKSVDLASIWFVWRTKFRLDSTDASRI
jgi:hypothetical protein